VFLREYYTSHWKNWSSSASKNSAVFAHCQCISNVVWLMCATCLSAGPHLLPERRMFVMWVLICVSNHFLNEVLQGWVIRTSETSHTVKYAINTQYAYNTKTYLCYFGGCPGLAPTTLQPPRIVPPASRTL
jgi:hypothetical protein